MFSGVGLRPPYDLIAREVAELDFDRDEFPIQDKTDVGSYFLQVSLQPDISHLGSTHEGLIDLELGQLMFLTFPLVAIDTFRAGQVREVRNFDAALLQDDWPLAGEAVKRAILCFHLSSLHLSITITRAQHLLVSLAI